MVQRLTERDARLAGRGDGAVEARQVNHLDDGANSAALGADSLRPGAVELDLGGGIRLVAELVLQPLEADRVLRAIRPVTRHQVTGEAAFCLGEHEEGVAHRRRHEPFVAADLDMVAVCGGARDVGAHVGATLALGHAHAQRDAVLLPPGQTARIVGAGLDLRQPLRKKRWLGPQRAHAGMRHGDRAHMAALGLRREIEADRAGRHRRRTVAAVVGGGMDAVADALLHQCVIGGMELDQIEAVALAVHGAELRRVLVGHPPEIERVAGAVVLSAGRQGSEVEARPHRRVGQRPVGREQVEVAEGRRLVERGVFEEA